MNDFEEYVLRYCKKHEVTPEEAKTHKLVQEVKKYYDERENGVVNEKTINYISSQEKTRSEEA